MMERIKTVRKALNLTQQEFSDRLGIKRNTLANYETGRNVPVDAVFALICREFNVNEVWLRTGEGEMFVQLSRDDEIAQFFGAILNSADDKTFKKRFISMLSRLDESDWVALERMAKFMWTEKEEGLNR